VARRRLRSNFDFLRFSSHLKHLKSVGRWAKSGCFNNQRLVKALVLRWTGGSRGSVSLSTPNREGCFAESTGPLTCQNPAAGTTPTRCALTIVTLSERPYKRKAFKPVFTIRCRYTSSRPTRSLCVCRKLSRSWRRLRQRSSPCHCFRNPRTIRSKRGYDDVDEPYASTVRRTVETRQCWQQPGGGSLGCHQR